jgi:RHH-type proline utilization regulon transcriptional repressor/proline dehydrogenase/delta 1-pyrroline-5-carboxylate dehydrogenase
MAERLPKSLDTLLVGQAERFGTDVPPLIEAAAQRRVECVVERAVADGASATHVAKVPVEGGFFCAPTLLTGVEPDARIVRDEIFGPVTTIEPVPSVTAACDVVEGLAHALTGGLFSRIPRTIAEVARRTPVGNLYINRGTTGAMVGRQPFGGNTWCERLPTLELLRERPTRCVAVFRRLEHP